MKAKILRYTEDVQKQLHSKTKPEPWLHIAILSDKQYSYYVIYVWDTRQIVGSDNIYKHYGDIAGQPAKDNHMPLQGKANLSNANELVKQLNEQWLNDNAKTDASVVLNISNERELLNAAKEHPNLARYFVILQYWHQYAEGITGANHSLTCYTGKDGNGWDSKQIKAIMKDCKAYAKANNRRGRETPYGDIGAVQYNFTSVSLAEINAGTDKLRVPGYYLQVEKNDPN